MICIKRFAVGVLILLVVSSVSQVYVQHSVGDEINPNTYQENYTSALEDIDRIVLFMLKLGHMPSLAVSIVKKNEVVLTKMYGEAIEGSGIPPTKDTVYLAGSISKSITGTAVMQLREQGMFDLDDDVNGYLPFSLRNPHFPDTPITFRMLLAHASGLANVQWRLFLYFSLLNHPVEQLGDYLTPGNPLYRPSNWCDFSPGSGSYYSSVGYELLSILIERLSGMSFVDYCSKYIFEPLKMNNSSFVLKDIEDAESAGFYAWLLGIYVRLPHYENHNAAAGGLQTTAEDLSHFLIMHMNDGKYDGVHVLKEDTVRLMHSIQYDNIPIKDLKRDGRGYGLGWIVWPEDEFNLSTAMQGHFGNVPGGITSMTYRNATGVVLLSNQWLLARPVQLRAMRYLRNLFFDFGDSL